MTPNKPRQTPEKKSGKMRGMLAAVMLLLVVSVLKTANCKPLSEQDEALLKRLLPVCVIETTDEINDVIYICICIYVYIYIYIYINIYIYIIIYIYYIYM